APQQRALIPGQRLNFGAEEAEYARGRHVETAKDVHRGRLARARWPHDRDKIAALDREVDPLQRLERGGSLAEGLGDPLELDDRLTRHYFAAFSEVTTFIPSLSSLDVTTVRRPSLRPVTTSIGSSVPSSLSTWTVWRLPRPIVARTSSRSRPKSSPPSWTPPACSSVAGSNRSAPLGTIRPRPVLSVAMLAVAVIPGRSRPSGLATVSRAS